VRATLLGAARAALLKGSRAVQLGEGFHGQGRIGLAVTRGDYELTHLGLHELPVLAQGLLDRRPHESLDVCARRVVCAERMTFLRVERTL
jgi:hypothetical protein